MTCEQCEREFSGYQCSCGWKAPSLTPVKPADIWHTRRCPDCEVTTIRERVGHRGLEMCTWCAKRIAKEIGVELEAKEQP